MFMFFCMMPILIVVAALPITLGQRIWKSSVASTSPAEAQTLRFLGMNLIEPALNIFLVGGLLWLFEPSFVPYLGESLRWVAFFQTLALTLPMAVLLVPLIGWNSNHAGCRRINRQLVALGLLRWGVTALSLIWLPALLAGIGIFIGSLVWVSQQANGIRPEDVVAGEWRWRRQPV